MSSDPEAAPLLSDEEKEPHIIRQCSIAFQATIKWGELTQEVSRKYDSKTFSSFSEIEMQEMRDLVAGARSERATYDDVVRALQTLMRIETDSLMAAKIHLSLSWLDTFCSPVYKHGDERLNEIIKEINK